MIVVLNSQSYALFSLIKKKKKSQTWLSSYHMSDIRDRWHMSSSLPSRKVLLSSGKLTYSHGCHHYLYLESPTLFSTTQISSPAYRSVCGNCPADKAMCLSSQHPYNSAYTNLNSTSTTNLLLLLVTYLSDHHHWPSSSSVLWIKFLSLTPTNVLGFISCLSLSSSHVFTSPHLFSSG